MGNSYTNEINEAKSKIASAESTADSLARRLNDNSHNLNVARINQKNLDASLASEQARLRKVITQQQSMLAADASIHQLHLQAVRAVDPSIRLQAFNLAVDHDKPIPAFRGYSK